jgi:DNA-binding SARP family transcriptional activator
MRFHLLGSLEVTDDNEQVDLGGGVQRAVLGYLLLHANQVVPTSRMLRALWDEHAPVTARKMVQNAVSGIRRTLGAHSDTAHSATTVLHTHSPGYRLQVNPDDVDMHHFRRLVDRGRAAIDAGDLRQGVADLRDGLSLWRGRALADLVERGTMWSELAAIENERLLAIEDCFDAELACGHHREITPELEILTEAEPLRERLCQQFMLALYRSGRQVDALNVYRRTRIALVDGLGIEPGRELQHLQSLILEHDKSIQAPMLVA